MASPSSSGLEEEMVSPSNVPITHVIFDFDGTLIDTQPFYTSVQERVLARFGKPYDRSIEARLSGKKPAESSRNFVEESGLASLFEERKAMLNELFPSCQLLPGAKRLVGHLHANGIPMCVATGPVVMIPHAGLNDSHCKEADQILSSLLDFNPSQWGLPPFENRVI